MPINIIKKLQLTEDFFLEDFFLTDVLPGTFLIFNRDFFRLIDYSVHKKILMCGIRHYTSTTYHVPSYAMTIS